MNFMLNKLAGYGISFYLCPTENESGSVAQKSLLIGRDIIDYQGGKLKKNLQLLHCRGCEIKKSLYLCSPNKMGAQG